MKYNNNGNFKNLSIPAKTTGIPMETTRTDVASWGTYNVYKGELAPEAIGDLLFYEEPKILRRGIIIGEVGEDSLSVFKNDHSVTITFLNNDKKVYTKQEVADIIPGTVTNKNKTLYNFSNFFDLSDFQKNSDEKVTLRVELSLSQEEGKQFVGDSGKDKGISFKYAIQVVNKSYSDPFHGYETYNNNHMEKIKEDGTLWRYDSTFLNTDDVLKCMLSPGEGYFCIKLIMSTK